MGPLTDDDTATAHGTELLSMRRQNGFIGGVGGPGGEATEHLEHKRQRPGPARSGPMPCRDALPHRPGVVGHWGNSGGGICGTLSLEG